MIISVKKILEFPYGHALSKNKRKCKFSHGHTARVEVEITTYYGGQLNKDDMIIDFHDLNSIIYKIINEKYDHSYFLNSVDEDLYKDIPDDRKQRLIIIPDKDPTSEVLAKMLFFDLENAIKIFDKTLYIKELTFWESSTTCVKIYANNNYQA